MKVWIVDAFTSEPFKGNPAAVILVDEFPKDKICQALAAELNLSETTFVKPLEDNKYHIRWFTPLTEVELCGHATLAASHILYQEKLLQRLTIDYQSLSGLLRVTKSTNGITLDFPLQKVGDAFDPIIIEAALDTKVNNVLHAYDDIIVELEDEDTVRNLDVNFNKLKDIDCRGVIITAKANKKYDFVSRFFAPKIGVYEDPVTGSSHCKLAHYWGEKLNKTELFAYQASHRGGELNLKIEEDRVLITGNAVTIMQGNLLFPK